MEKYLLPTAVITQEIARCITDPELIPDDVERGYDIQNDRMYHVLRKLGKGYLMKYPPGSLLLSLDDFAEKYITPFLTEYEASVKAAL